MANEVEKVNGIEVGDIEKINGRTDANIENLSSREFVAGTTWKVHVYTGVGTFVVGASGGGDLEDHCDEQEQISTEFGWCDCACNMFDCNGDCGGDAIIDECGVCNGDGIADGACDCDGNVDLGCGCGEAGPSGCDNACGSTTMV